MKLLKYFPPLFFLVFLDQLTKFLVKHSALHTHDLRLTPFLSLLYAQNTGVAFSLFAQWSSLFLSITTAVILIIVLVFFLNAHNNPAKNLACLFILAGAMGNFFDRLRLGYVIDFIYFHIEPFFHFAVFNLADCFITAGAFLFILGELMTKQPEKH